jgi:hypothetical protein
VGVLSGTIFAWSRYALTPVQHYYLGTYLNCTLEGSDPAFSSEVRWLYKTAPRGTQELATDQDVVPAASSGDRHILMRLSSEAQKRGWTGLAQGPEEWLPIPRLEPFLESHFYAGRSLWRLLMTPLLWSVAMLFLLLAGEDFFRSRHFARRRDMERIDWGEPPPSLVWRWRTTIGEVRIRLLGFAKSSARKDTTKVASVAAAPTPVKVPKKAAHATVPLFGATDRTRKDGFVWSGKDEID